MAIIFADIDFGAILGNLVLNKQGVLNKSLQKSQKGYIAICAIMKNESIGILEWIAYHRALGVEKFYLFDNRSEDDTVAKVAPLHDAGIVELIDWPLRPGQLQSYDYFAHYHRNNWFWCAFIDIDEYINPFGYDNIPDWLCQFEDKAGVAIQWVNFGPNNLDEPPKNLAIEAYNTRFDDLHIMHGHVKTIVRMSAYDHAQTPHSFVVNEGEIVDEMNVPVAYRDGDYAIQTPMYHNDVCLNHYYTRSRSEWSIKIDRGLADVGEGGQNSRNPSWIDIYEREAVFPDERIHKFAAEAKSMLAILTELLPGSVTNSRKKSWFGKKTDSVIVNLLGRNQKVK